MATVKLPVYIIDFDSTLITGESLDLLAAIALADNPRRDAVMRQLSELTELGMSGQLSFERSLRQRLALFAAKEQHVTLLANQLVQMITPSALRNRDWFEDNAERIYIVSGGFEEYIRPVAHRLGIAADHVFGNRFIIDGTGNIQGYDRRKLPSRQGGKAQQVAALELTQPCIVLGDGYTDYEVKQAGLADAFWAFCENIQRPPIVAVADRTVSDFDEVARISFVVR